MDIFKTWLCTTPIAHRGLHNDEFPENSLGAFENACQKGYAIELDVRIIDDGEIIVFHDDGLSRITANDGYASNLKSSDLADLKLLKTDYAVPTFREVLDLVNGRVPLLIEIKNTGKVGILEKKLLEMLKGYEGEYAVQSFNPYSIEFFKINAPHIMRGQLSCFFKNSDISKMQRFVLKRLMLNNVSKPDFIAYAFENLPNRYVNKFKHLPVLAWTIRCNSDHAACKDYCNNIIFEGYEPTT